MWVPWLALLLAAGAIVLSLMALRDVRELSRRAVSWADATFRQAELLRTLDMELGLARPLPATRGWAASPDFLLILAGQIRQRRPGTVVECSSGVSTIVAARTLQQLGSGHVYSLEQAPEHAAKTRARLAEHGLDAWATVLDAPLIEHTLEGAAYRWYDMRTMPPASIELLVIDGPPKSTNPQARYPAGPLLFPRLAPAAIVLLDDADRRDEQAAVARWLEQFPALVYNALECEKGCVLLEQGGAAWMHGMSG